MRYSNGGATALRLFIALPIPEAVQVEAERVQKELGKLTPGDSARWLRSDQFHLTLRFLGRVESDRTEALIAAARAACDGFAPFQLRAAQLGFFPDERRPRVLWMGVQGEMERLGALQNALDAATRSFAEKQEDRAFSAHLTLARLKSLRPPEARALAERVRGMTDHAFGAWTADVVEVMRSELHPAGSRYTCLAEILLTGAS